MLYYQLSYFALIRTPPSKINGQSKCNFLLQKAFNGIVFVYTSILVKLEG